MERTGYIASLESDKIAVLKWTLERIFNEWKWEIKGSGTQ